MTEEEDKLQADKWARESLEHLSRDGLAPMPENFAVYYAYHSGSDGNLKMAMDALLHQFGRLTQQQCSTLYQNHLSLEAEHKALTTATANIENELSRVMLAIDQTTAGTQKYDKSLNTFSGSLQSSPSMDQIREAVARVANETRAMAEQNQRLQSQLTQSTQQLTEMRYNLDVVRKDSLRDPLTEIGNRKYFDAELARATTEAAETGMPLSMLMIDIDYFKKFNDSYGHLIGDQVLRLVARTLIENLKGRDVIARYGGEEFVILLTNTNVASAEKVANQLRISLGSKQIKRKNTNETLGVVTISLGAAEYFPKEPLDGFIARADAALYDAKQTGRNKVMSRLLSMEEMAKIRV
ncbi:MAG: GGDEF domain-containing protein [Alphaproteobacteria bacterium]|nr:GGDEF domain-containing protein [Alphaproteobacteria bacterium]